MQKEEKICNKKVLKFNGYKYCLLKNEIILKSQQRFKSEAHNMYTEKVNKTALSTNDNKRYLNFDGIHPPPPPLSLVQMHLLYVKVN